MFVWTFRSSLEAKISEGLEVLKFTFYLKLIKKEILDHSIQSGFVVPKLALRNKKHPTKKGRSICHVLWTT